MALDYQFVTEENKLEGIQKRIGQLEAEHYSLEIYTFEAEAFDDERSLAELRSKQSAIEISVNRLREKLSEFGEPDEKESG